MKDVLNIREIQEWLITQIAELLYIEPDTIDIHENFSNYGLSSRDAVILSGDLEELLSRRLSPTLAYDHPSILLLSQFLTENKESYPSAPNENSSKNNSNEPIAIIGMGCRFPGAKDPESFWQLLSEGIDKISEVPLDRWPKEAFYHPDPAVPGKAISYWGGFLDNIDQFDPFFFGISPIEAKHMDPQQRLLMELAYEALDDAGQSKEDIDGSKTGVFIGISVNEYSQFQLGDPMKITSHSGTGSALAIAANRISYFFNFRGPSIAIDTACSSSLVAVHLACQSLRNGESRMALAGGVNMILSPAHSIAFTKAGVLAPDGRCKTFDARANGYVRGEGGGVVVLKLLSAALADGDPIHALIPGSAMSQDGRTNGLMAPSQESQEIMLREAYLSAGINPGSVQYVEAHGTGTLLGDSMEAAALGAVIGTERTQGPCAIGSVKTNFGHLEAAAGMAGLIKVILSIKNRTIPPSLHYHSPNPHVPFEELNLQVQNERKPWPSAASPAIAGVSSFGFGGTNVHVVVQEAEQYQKEEKNEQFPLTESNCYILPLSANSNKNLRSLASNFQNLLASGFEITTKDICYAASKRRSQYDYRLVAMGNSRSELSNSIQAFIEGEQHPNLLLGGMVPDRQPKLVFVFSGQGGQWLGMGRELLKKEAVFYRVIERIDQIIQTQFEWSLMEALLAEHSESREEEIDKVQPMIFAIQFALVELWQSWGITPDAVIGHSMGEVAAAQVAGILNLEDAIRVICLRSQLLMSLQGQGSMMATELSPDQAKEVLKGYENDISIAAINGPTSTVLSGAPEKMEEIMTVLQQQNLFCKLVKVDVASHSPQIDQLRPEMIKVLEGLQPQPARIPIYSTVTGTRGDDLVFNADYWVDNLRKPVLFSDAIGQLLDSNHSLFMEIGPHPILLSSIQQSIQALHQEVSLLPSLRREEGEQEVLLRTLGALYNEGFLIDWDKLYPSPGKYVQLPAISWQRQRYWMDTKTVSSKNPWHRTETSHPLLGDRMNLANSPSTFVWQISVDDEVLNYLTDHRVEEEVVFPAAAYIEMALQSVEEIGLKKSHVLSDFAFKKSMVLEKGEPRSIQVLLSPDEANGFLFSVYSQTSPKEKWVLHASATFIENQADNDLEALVDTLPEVTRQKFASQITTEDFYLTLQQRGIQYGPTFRGIQQVWSNGNESLGHISLPESLHFDRNVYQIHPALLDACLQVLAATQSASFDQSLYLPTGCKRIRFFSRPGQHAWSHVILRSETDSGADNIEADIRLFDENYQIVAELIGFRLQRTSRRVRQLLTPKDTWLYQLGWQTQSGSDLSSVSSRVKRNWLIFADDGGLGELLAEQLEVGGDNCTLLLAGEALKKLKNGDEGEFLEIMEKLVKETPSPLYGIIHLWSLSIPPQSLDASETLHIMPKLGCNSVLYLVKALAKRFAGSPRLWLVTQGAQSVQEGEPVAAEQSAMWGFGKVISYELPEFKCVRIDLDPQQSKVESVQLLSKQISIDDREDQIAFRSGDRFVLRLLPFTQKSHFSTSEISMRSDGSYLITGGLGGLGLLTAKWLVQRGARHLVLLGRSEPSPLASRVVDQIRQEGVEVVVAQVDVSDQGQVKTLFEKIELHMPMLRGVIHAAGLLDDGALLDLDKERMQNVMAPKVEGTWNLHEATSHLTLDFFVLFSSAVSVLGSPGQGNYAAASSYLDAMAYFRQNMGLPALSINWGPWAEVGLAAEATEKLEEQNASTQHLVKVIKIDQGMEILELLLADPIPQVAVLPFDLKNLLELYPTAAGMPFFAEVGGSETHVARLYARPNLRQKYVAPRSEVELKMAELWQQTLHIDRVGIHDSFFELGGDSVLAAQILALARKVYGISINPQEAFQSFTIERLAEMLEEEILKQIEEMSEEEVQRRLSEEK